MRAAHRSSNSLGPSNGLRQLDPVAQKPAPLTTLEPNRKCMAFPNTIEQGVELFLLSLSETLDKSAATDDEEDGEKSERVRKPKHSLDANRTDGKDKSQRSAATVRRLKMYKVRPKRDRKGKFLSNEFQSKELPDTRIQPDRRWFGNTRVFDQKELSIFREELEKQMSNRYKVILNPKTKQTRVHLLEREPFKDAFEPKSKRKRPKLMAANYESLAKNADCSQDKFEQEHDEAAEEAGEAYGFRDLVRHTMFEKGQSKRIWGELYKVVDSSDVVVQVLDARDPQGTRCYHLEKHLKEHCKHKQLILLLYKWDLVPAWATKGWLKVLSAEFPTLAFHASINKSFGKGSLLSVLRQFSRLKSDKQAISAAFAKTSARKLAAFDSCYQQLNWLFSTPSNNPR